MSAATKKCPYCAEEIQIEALKCKHCGELIDEKLRLQREAKKEQHWSPGVAAVLSLVIPGAGQMYKGQVMEGFFWLIGTVIGYFLVIVPGIISHILCVLDAVKIAKKKTEKITVPKTPVKPGMERYFLYLCLGVLVLVVLVSISLIFVK